MRSTLEADREANRGESGFIRGESKIPIEALSPLELSTNKTLEELTAFRKAIFGSDKVSDSTQLQWSVVRKDNILVRQLKQATLLFGHAVAQQAKQTEKDIRKAQRVFYGR